MTRRGAVGALVALGILLGTTAAGGAQGPGPAASSVRTALPLVVIDSRGRIPNAPKVSARMRIVHHPGAPNTFRERGNVYDGLVGIEVRGHSSAQFPKKSYAVETRDARGGARNVSLLGMPKENDWILYASYNDKTLMRNALAHWTVRQLGRYSSRTRLVELVLNGRYEGVYVLMERVKRGPSRVQLSDVGLSGAYLLELTTNARVQQKELSSWFRLPATGKPAEFYDPKAAGLRPAERAWITKHVTRFERVLYGETFADARTGYRRLLDVPAAVDFVLLNELFKNQDAMMSSTYVGKGAGAKLRMGPVWDFDLALGNTFYQPGGTLEGWMLKARPWTVRLYRDPVFAAAAAARWRKLRSAGLVDRMVRHIDSTARALTRAQAQQRNFQRWRILGVYVWPNAVDPATGTYPRTYTAEVRLMKSWLTRRAEWIDRNIGSMGSS